jgi:hypothetical protein
MLVITSRSNSEVSDTEETTRISWDDHKGKLSFFFIIIFIFELAPADTRYTSYMID